MRRAPGIKPLHAEMLIVAGGITGLPAAVFLLKSGIITDKSLAAPMARRKPSYITYYGEKQQSWRGGKFGINKIPLMASGKQEHLFLQIQEPYLSYRVSGTDGRRNKTNFKQKINGEKKRTEVEEATW